MRQEASKWLAFTIISYLRLHLPWCIANIILNQPIAEWDELHSKEREVSFSCFSRKWNEQKYSSFGGTTSSIMHCANHLEPTNKNEMTNGNVATRWKLMAYGQFRTTTPMITCVVHIVSWIYWSDDNSGLQLPRYFAGDTTTCNIWWKYEFDHEMYITCLIECTCVLKIYHGLDWLPYIELWIT